MNGEMVGINTAIIASGRGSLRHPSRPGQPLIPQLVSTGGVTEAILGSAFSR